jgi:hypothetical protein
MDQKPTGQSMPTSQSIQDDVLHSTGHTQLTQEEIAKAIAHHDKHHAKDKMDTPSKSGAGKSPKKNK